MRLRVVGLAAIILAWVTAAAFAASNDGTITIGLQAAMTGDLAEYGKSFERSIFMARDEINAAGGVLGRKLEVKVADSRGEPKEAASIANQFTNDSTIVGVIGDFNSANSLAAMPIYDRNDCVLLSPTSSHPKLVESKWFFRVIQPITREAASFGEWAVKDFGKTAAIFLNNNDWGHVHATSFQSAFEKGGGKVLAQEAYSLDVKDFRALITKMKALNPSVVYLASMYTDAALILQQAKELRFAPKFVASMSLHNDALLRIGGDAVNGLYLGTEFFPEDSRPVVQEFIKRFQTRYNMSPNLYNALPYDAFYVIVNALKTTGRVDRAALRDAIEKSTKNFNGVTGVMSIGADHEPQKKLFKLVIQGGKFAMYK